MAKLSEAGYGSGIGDDLPVKPNPDVMELPYFNLLGANKVETKYGEMILYHAISDSGEVFKFFQGVTPGRTKILEWFVANPTGVLGPVKLEKRERAYVFVEVEVDPGDLFAAEAAQPA